jgi:uracil-DNA glycosylase family 4
MSSSAFCPRIGRPRIRLSHATPYLDQQIEIIQPRLIITLGNVAACYLLGKFDLRCESMERIHRKIHEVSSLTMRLRIVPMYHPASALRDPGLRRRLV